MLDGLRAALTCADGEQITDIRQISPPVARLPNLAIIFNGSSLNYSLQISMGLLPPAYSFDDEAYLKAFAEKFLTQMTKKLSSSGIDILFATPTFVKGAFPKFICFVEITPLWVEADLSLGKMICQILVEPKNPLHIVES